MSGPVESALLSGGIHVVLQPIVDLRAGVVFGQEALVRGSLPGLSHPPEIIRAALEHDYMGRLGRELRRMAVAACPTQRLFLNVHPIEFAEGCLVQPDDPMFSHGHPVYLELTESIPLSLFAFCKSTLTEVRNKGVSVVLDDLGAGYSNLKYIADLAPEMVKIDRELVADLEEHERARRLLKAIVRMCEDMGAQVVAEGVETVEQLRIVVDAGAHFAQGYYLARPAFPAPSVRAELLAAAGVSRPAAPVLPSAEAPRPAGFYLDRKATPVWGLTTVTPRAKRILLVEDDAAIAEGITNLLTDEGYEVSRVALAADVLATARETPPSLIILDVTLPDGDGFSVAEELIRDRRTMTVPILFLSGVEDLSLRTRQFRQGITDFLKKPHTGQDLLARIERGLCRAEEHSGLRRHARIDELTGLGNMRFLQERLAVETSRIERYKTDLTLIVMDVDRMKATNDLHGHAAGSAMLKAIGESLTSQIRDTDLAARYGGDEFVVVLPHTSLHDGEIFAERLLADLHRPRPGALTISVSMGLASYDPAVDKTVQNVFERADVAAYRAKRLGGNQICCDPIRNSSAA